MAERPKSGSSGGSLDDLPTLIARLGEDLVTLIDSKLGLLKVEIKEDATAYARGALTVAVGGIVAAVGFSLLNVAIALLVTEALVPSSVASPVRYALGFLVLGSVYLVGGLVLAKRGGRHVTAVQPSVAASVHELEKDRKWLAADEDDT